MDITSVIKKVYPIYESNINDPAVKNLGEYLDSVYNKGGTWTYKKIRPTMGEVAQLYDVYKNIVHDHVNFSDIKTISSTVKNILQAMGFNVKPDGVGWALTEVTLKTSDEEKGKLFKTFNLYSVYLKNGPVVLYQVYDPSGNKIFTSDSPLKACRFAKTKAGLKEQDSIVKLPDWANKALADKMSKEITGVQDKGDSIDVTSKVNGKTVTYNVSKTGKVTEI